MKGRLRLLSVVAAIVFLLVCPHTSFAARDGGYDVTSSLWAKADLQVSGSPVTLVWKAVGTDITPSGDQVISGYFYADPNSFAYGSQYNPEVFVKIYIAKNGWCNIAFNHVTVDNVTVYSAHQYVGVAQKTGTAKLTNRLVEHQYNDVAIQSSSSQAEVAAAGNAIGYSLTSGLWAQAFLQPSSGPITLIWKKLGSEKTPSGDLVVSGYFYASPNDFAYGSVYNPELFVKIYVATNGWANIAFNHVTVDNVSISSAHNYTGFANQTGTASLNSRLVEHQYNGVRIDDESDATIPGAPTIDTITVGEGQVTVSFTAPSSNGGSTITGYIVTSSPGGETATGTTSPITVTGLTNGTAYTFTVQAINTVGTGPASTVSESVTPVAAAPGKIPDTGQTTSYTSTFGEDSDYTINPPSYAKLDANGKALPYSASSWAMVKDNVTGLTWENKTDDGSIHDRDNEYTWYDPNPVTNGGNAGTVGNGTDTKDFIDALNSASFGGFNDWRLPTAKELSTLVHSDKLYPEPAINAAYFQNTMSSYYWSSTTYAGNPVLAWGVYFYYGVVSYVDKSFNYYVRAVRGGQSGAFGNSVIPGRMLDNRDGTVTDTKTGLMWQQGEAGDMNWTAALIYCESLNFPPAKYNDWRLPNRNELQSLVDYSEYGPEIDIVAFPGAASSYYWSSTTDALYPESAWYVPFGDGYVGSYNKSVNLYVRAVRGGQ
jgi:hypothetical protein